MDDISPKKIKEAKANLRARGIALSDLCRDNDVPYQAARDLLRGRLKGHRGDAHRAAVLLGIKPNPEKLAA